MSNNTATVCWVPVLMLEGPDLEPGITASFYERLPGNFATSSGAMDAGKAAAAQRPDAIGYSAKRVEVSHGL